MRRKFKAKIFSVILLAVIIPLITSIDIFVDNKNPNWMEILTSGLTPSSIYTVNVTITHASVTEKIMFADHTSSRADGNWIELSGGTPIEIPELTLNYEGVSSATYERNDRTITIDAEFSQKEAVYPLTQHPIYYAGDTVTATFHGTSQLAGKKVNISLIETSPLEVSAVLNEAFKGNIQPLRSLLSGAVREVPCTLDADGDYVQTFTAPDPGDSILFVLYVTSHPY